MPLFQQKDNADAQLNANISASTLAILVKSGEGALFPQPVKSAATSGGSSILLNLTGASGLGFTVGDYIFNITDGSWAFIIAINTNDIETTSLFGGSDNTWENTDEIATRRFVATLNKRDSNGDISQSEQILIDERATDTLTVPTGGRGYNGTTPATYDADDYISILVDELLPDGLEDVLSGLDRKKFENDFSQGIPNDTTLKGVDNAGTSLLDLLKVTTSDILEFQILPRLFSARSISHDNDIIDKKYFDDNLPGLSVLSKTEAAAATREVFENTDNSNDLGWKDSGDVVHDIIDQVLLDAQINITVGQASFSPSGVDETDVTAHGLGRTPRCVTIVWETSGGGAAELQFGGTVFYDGTTQADVETYSSGAGDISSRNTFTPETTTGTNGWTGTVTFDGTNITITASSFTAAAGINYAWKAE